MSIRNITAHQLKSLIERIERLEEEKAALGEDIKEVFAEAKGHGYDTKIMRLVLKIRKMEPAARQEQEALLETYLAALGDGTPLERAARSQAGAEATIL